MFFKNLTIFRFPASFGGMFPTDAATALGSLESLLAQCPLRPCGALEMNTRGFVSPFGRDEQPLVHRQGGHAWITLGGEDKLLPAAVVNAALSRKLRDYERANGRSAGGRLRKRLKEEVVHELLPRAFAKPGRCDAYFDFARGLLVVDSPSRKRAEQVVSEIRHATGSFPALPLNAEGSPRAVLTAWLAGDVMPDGMRLGESCILEDPSDDSARVTVRNLDLASDEISAHLQAGMQCTRLALVLDDRVSFEFGEDLQVRKLKFLDGAVDTLDASEREDVRAELDARFALMTGEVGRLFDLLQESFSLSVPEDDDPSYAEQGQEPAPTDRARPKRTRELPSGSSTVTISGQGIEPITLTAQEFRDAPKRIAEFTRAVDAVRAAGKPSISRLQRDLKIGYNHAARLIEQMEAMGYVSPPDSQGRRSLINKGAVH